MKDFEISVTLYFIIKESSTEILNRIIGFKVLRATNSTKEPDYNIDKNYLIFANRSDLKDFKIFA